MGELRTDEWDVAKAASGDAYAVHGGHVEDVLGTVCTEGLFDLYIVVHQETLRSLGWRPLETSTGTS